MLAVDEDADVVRDVERELGDRYGRRYRVVCLRSRRYTVVTVSPMRTRPTVTISA